MSKRSARRSARPKANSNLVVYIIGAVLVAAAGLLAFNIFKPAARAPGELQWTEAPAIVRTRIFNTDGRLIRTLAEAHFSGFEYTATWDGRDDAGERVPIGRYIVLVDAFLEAQKTSRSYKKTVVVAALLSP